MKFSLMQDNYFPFQAGKSYKQIDEGIDWVKLKYRKQVYFVDKQNIDQDPISSLYETEDCVEMELYDLFI